MKSREKRKMFLLYPEDKAKEIWEMIISLTLLIMCVITPIYIAFHHEETVRNRGIISWDIINLTIDILFAIDIFVIFMSAYHDIDFKLIEDRKIIACNYIRGMFIVDFLAEFPFEAVLTSDQQTKNINGMIRMTRIGRLYKLIKLTRLVKMLKFVKKKGNLIKYVTQDLLKLGIGFERIMFFIFTSLLICHIFACLWIFFIDLAPDGTVTWLDDERYSQ